MRATKKKAADIRMLADRLLTVEVEIEALEAIEEWTDAQEQRESDMQRERRRLLDVIHGMTR